MQHSTVVPVWLCLYLELKLWNLESGCQGATLTHSSKSVNLEHSEAVCAQATGPVSRVLVLLESCVAKAVAGDAGGLTTSVTGALCQWVCRARDQIAPHWAWWWFVTCTPSSNAERKGNAFVNA